MDSEAYLKFYPELQCVSIDAIGIVDIVRCLVAQSQRSLMERPVCHMGRIEWLYVESLVIGSLKFHFIAHAIRRQLLLGGQLDDGKGAQHWFRCGYPETLSSTEGEHGKLVRQ